MENKKAISGESRFVLGAEARFEATVLGLLLRSEI